MLGNQSREAAHDDWDSLDITELNLEMLNSFSEDEININSMC